MVVGLKQNTNKSCFKNCIFAVMKTKHKPKKKKIRIPLPKQLPKVKESDKLYRRSKTKRIDEE